jgi:hypothetical protein
MQDGYRIALMPQRQVAEVRAMARDIKRARLRLRGRLQQGDAR